MQDLALGTETQTVLAAKYGVSSASITAFKQRHAEEIADIVANSEAEFSGILLAKKENRLAMYQTMVEKAEDDDDHKLAARLLRQMAEELGHLPTRLQVSGQLDTQTRYIIEGPDGPIDPELMR